MKIITTTNGVVLDYANEITFGIWDEPNLEKWKIQKDEFMFYMIDNDFMVYEVENIPDDFIGGKYCYNEENGFYENPDYIKPERITLEERIAALEKQNQALVEENKMLSDCILELSAVVYA